MQRRRQSITIAVIKLARRLIANTPIQRLSITTALYKRIFRLGYSDAEITTPFRGLTLKAPNTDITVVPGLIGGYYEKIELDIFEKICLSSRVFVDVGANIGIFTCLAAARQPAGGRVIAFEPVPENLQYLRLNIADKMDRVTIEAKAVGEMAGNLDIFLVEGSIGTHSASAKNAADSSRSVTVPVVNLDAYLDEPVDVLKVDVEGYEGHVLRGATNTLTVHRPTLFIEFAPSNLSNCGFPPEEFVDLIFGLYDEVWVIDEPRATFRRAHRDRLIDSFGGHKLFNLVAIQSTTHPVHSRIASQFAG